MIAVLLFLPSTVLGWALARMLMPVRAEAARWARWLVEISLGFALGAGICSGGYFLLTWAGLAGRAGVLAFELGLLAAGILLLLRWKRGEAAPQDASPRFAWIWALRIAAALALLFFLLDCGESLAHNPQGDWDAFSIWNLRAKFLASGSPAWRNAVSDRIGYRMFGAVHPGYPLLNSGFIAAAWTLVGQDSADVPAAASVAFALAVCGLLFGSLAVLRAESIGLLGLLALLATETFAAQAAAQYADIPLSVFVLSAVALAALASESGWPRGPLILAGLCAGFAAWTKNEGLAFLPCLLVAVLWRGGLRAALWTAAGAAPPVALTAVLKIFLAPGVESLFPRTAGAALAKIADPSRWVQSASAFAHRFWELGFPLTHPVLLLALLALGFGFAGRDWVRSHLWLLLPPAALLGADFAIYLVTTADLTWHLNTSSHRLVLQAWPALVFAFLAMLRLPAAAAKEPAAARKRPRRTPISKRTT